MTLSRVSKMEVSSNANKGCFTTSFFDELVRQHPQPFRGADRTNPNTRNVMSSSGNLVVARA